jgi:FtsZ-binding cell division protein ZapB
MRAELSTAAAPVVAATIKSFAIAAIAIVILGVLIAYFVHRHNVEQAVAERVRQQHETLHRQNEARRRQQAWQTHLRRLAWQKAYPEEYARQLEAERARLKREEQDRLATGRAIDVAREARRAREYKESHPCETAIQLTGRAVQTGASGNFQGEYDSAVSGLHYVALCDRNPEVHNVPESHVATMKGWLLFAKAQAEHGLSSGDWQTDMNEAISVWAQCQTLPGVYGTHDAAQCQTFEETAISIKIKWEMNQ